MERKVEKISQSHDRMTITMQGTSERDGWMRVFPDPMPATHVITYNWQGMNLVIEPTPFLTQPAANPVNPAEPSTPKPDLSGMAEADLRTLAAEKGVKLTGKMSRAQMEAAVLEAVK